MVFTAFGAAFHTTARINASRFSADGVGVMLFILLLLILLVTLRLGEMLHVFRPLV